MTGSDIFDTTESNVNGLQMEIPLEPEFNLLAHYLALFGLVGGAFGVMILLLENGFNDVTACLVVIIAPVILAAYVARYLGEQFVKGLIAPILIGVPLSIISYFNEAANSCFCILFCSCPPPPSYYDLPRTFAVLGAAIFLIISIILQINGDKARGFGVFTGLLISTLVFMFATLVGFFGFGEL